MKRFFTKPRLVMALVFALVFLILSPKGFAETQPVCLKTIAELSSSSTPYTLVEYAVKRFQEDRCGELAKDPLIKDLVKKINEIGNPKVEAAASRFKISTDAFMALRAKAVKLQTPTKKFEKAKAELIKRIDTAILFITSEESGLVKVKNVPGAPIYPGQWEIAKSPAGFYGIPSYQSIEKKVQLLEIIDASNILTPDCRGVYKEACNNLVAPTLEFAKLYAIGQKIAYYYFDQTLRNIYSEIKTRNKKWDTYFFEALPQYPHEMWINSLCNKDTRLEDKDGNQLGPIEPPDWQFIFLHPSVGFEYVDKADSHSQFEPAINFEVLGYNKWKWGKSGDMKLPLGVAAVLTLSDRGGADAVGYGAMFHLNNKYSAGITYRDDGDLGFTVNVKLESFLRDTFKKYQQILKIGELSE